MPVGQHEVPVKEDSRAAPGTRTLAADEERDVVTEGGILAVGSIIEKPVVKEGRMEVGRRMRLTMSCDHRVIDGATGAQFLKTLKLLLENPLAMVW